jgi:4-amino-4-deoxy-L-arabinose transferase-like glycosyltransferase
MHSTSPERRTAWLVFSAALVVRLLFCFVVYPHLAEQFGGGDGYDEIAWNLVQGHGYTRDGVPAATERLPLYPLLLAASFALFGPLAWPWQLAQAAVGAATCALVYSFARTYAPRRGALLAAAFCAVHPTLLLYTARPLTETLYVFLLLLLVRVTIDNRRSGGPAGALLGLGLLIKTTALLHIVAFIGWLRRPGAARLVHAVLATVFVLSPWALWNLAKFGELHLRTATGGRALYHGLYISRQVGWSTPAGELNLSAEVELRRDLAVQGARPVADVDVYDAAAGHLARRWIADHPIAALRLWLRNLLLTWYLGRSRLSMLIHALLHGPLLIAAAIGARRLWHGGSRLRNLAVVSVALIVAYTTFHAAVQPAVRYILPVVPLAALLAAAAGRIDERATDD